MATVHFDVFHYNRESVLDHRAGRLLTIQRERALKLQILTIINGQGSCFRKYGHYFELSKYLIKSIHAEVHFNIKKG